MQVGAGEGEIPLVFASTHLDLRGRLGALRRLVDVGQPATTTLSGGLTLRMKATDAGYRVVLERDAVMPSNVEVDMVARELGPQLVEAGRGGPEWSGYTCVKWVDMEIANE